MTDVRDTARVIAPPPLVALGAVILGVLFDRLMPAYVVSAVLTRNGRIVICVLLVAAGVTLAVAGRSAFVRHGTSVNPFRPSRVLVTTGIFAYVRNPMYVGLVCLVAGVGIALASDWTLVMLVVAALLIHFGVVKREERYLEARFDDAYREYMAAVPRYGLQL